MRENQNKQSITIPNYFDSQTKTLIYHGDKCSTYIMYPRNTFGDIPKKALSIERKQLQWTASFDRNSYNRQNIMNRT